MTNRRTSTKLVSAFLGMSLLIAACGDDDDDGGATGPEETTTTADGDGEGQAGGELVLGAEQWPECLNPFTQCANASWLNWAITEHVLPRLMELDVDGNYVPSPVLDGEPEVSGEGTDNGEGPFTVTYTIAEEAVWEDESPMTCADLEFTWQATLDSTGSITTTGYELIESVEPVDGDDHVCAMTYTEPYAAWPDLFGGGLQFFVKAAAFPDITGDTIDTGTEMSNEIPFSGAPFILESFSATEAVLVRNEAYWDEERVPLLDQVTMVPQESQETEVNALLAGEVSAIYPQPAPGLTEQLTGDDSLETIFGAGTTFEGIWFNTQSLLDTESPLYDPAVREALLFAIDRETILTEVIHPLSPEAELLNCHSWVPTVGEWCDVEDYADVSFDPEQVASILEGAGWARGSDGIYAKDGQRLEFTWQTVAGNARREQIQALVIPQLEELGIAVTADNSEAGTLFEQLLPQRQTEMMLFAYVASPDPTATSNWHCDNIPTPENDFAGQNAQSWCNEEASEAMSASDRAIDVEERLEQIHLIGDLQRADAIGLPMYQLPLITSYNTEVIGGPVGDFTSSPYGGFSNMYDWFLN